MKPSIYPQVAIRAFFIIMLGLLGSACHDEAPKTIDETIEIEDAARARVTLLAEPSTTVAGDALSATVQLTDDAGAPIAVAGTPVSIFLNKNQFATGEARVRSTTDADGVAHFEFTIEHAAKNYQLAAVSVHQGSQTLSATTSFFDIGAAAPSSSTSTISSAEGVADEARSVSINIGIFDVYGNPIPGVVPEFSASGEGNVYHACSATDITGMSACAMATTRAGTRTIELHAPVQVAGGAFEVRAAAPDADTSTISGTDAVINDAEGAQITIQLIDRFGNPVLGVVPSFEATGDGNHYAPCSISNEDGMSECIMTSSDAGLKTLHITEPLYLEGDTIEFAWDCDAEATPFGGGSGDTEDDPYRLCTPQHLTAIEDHPSYMDKYFVVARDIDMEGVSDFHMIGSASQRFSGHFDGNHRRIRNLVLHRHTDEYVGLFRYIGVGGRVENLSLEDIDLEGGEWVGGLAGYNNGSISGADVNGSVRGNGRVTGGLVGDNRVDGSIMRSHVRGSIEGVSWVGGLVGYNTGAIDTSYANSDVVGDDRHVGGLVGLNDLHGSVTGSYAAGSVAGPGTFIGGLVGLNSGLIGSSYATCDVSGGLSVGGLVGHNGRPQKLGQIRDAYSVGHVQGDGAVGGLVGENEHGDIRHAYWDVETSGNPDSDGGEGLSTESFADIVFFRDTAGWDFNETWDMGAMEADVERPMLQWQVGEAQQ